MSIQDRIRLRLKQLGKNPRQAALDGGLHQDAIRNILRGPPSYSPRADTLRGLMRGLDVEEAAYFLDRSDEHFLTDATAAPTYTSGGTAETHGVPQEAIDMHNDRLDVVDEFMTLPNEAVPLVRRYVHQLRQMADAQEGKHRPAGPQRPPQKRRKTSS